MAEKQKQPYTHLTVHEVNLLVRFYKNGVTIPRLVKIFGISFNRVRDIININGAYKFRIMNFDMEGRNREIRRLRHKGYTLEYISDEYGLTKQRIQQIINNPHIDDDLDEELNLELSVIRQELPVE